MDLNGVSGLPVVDASGALVGVVSQTDLVRARATEHLWAELAGLAVRHLMTRPAVTAAIRAAREPRPDGAARIHRLVVVEPRPETPVGVISPTDVVHPSRSSGRVPSGSNHADDWPRTRAPRSSTTRTGDALPVLDIDAYVEDFGGSSCRRTAAGVADASSPRTRRRPEHHPARHVGDPRLQPPGAAHPGRPAGQVRRLHGLRQRLPGHRDPRRRLPEPRSRARSRRSRRAADPAVADRRPAHATSHTQKYGDVPGTQGQGARRPSGCSSTRSTARAARSASRSARRWATTPS